MRRIEDYALIGNTLTAGLVSNDGSMEWLCLPRFDSPACFAAMLGTRENGCWRIYPKAEVRETRRRYRDGTLVLETCFETDSGTVTVSDFMPLPKTAERTDVVRIVQGESGSVPMELEFSLRFDYGQIVPWVRRTSYGIRAIAGPDSMQLHAPVPLRGRDFTTFAEFTVSAGERLPFTLSWDPSHLPEPEAEDPEQMLTETIRWWRDWSGRCRYDGPWSSEVRRSLMVLKALTYSPTGGIVAAPTTSLPEQLGGNRNWDYRFCWLRDATFTLYALLSSGYTEEAEAWRDWLLRAVAGRPTQLQAVYGIAGERRLVEMELPWLSGFEGCRPVRIGNAAYGQHQLDVWGEVIDSFHVGRNHKIETDDDTWRVERALLEFLEGNWRQPDLSIWEMRGPERQFTHSKVMAWVAADRAVKAVERHGLSGPANRWRALRQEIHAEVCEKGFDAEQNCFVQYYGSRYPDAALLMIPLVGFLDCHDRRVVGTVEAVQRELMRDGLVVRYRTSPEIDGLPPGEGAFLACSFWLVDNLAMMGRREEALALFERLLALGNDLGLFPEEYDGAAKQFCGNFPQAFSHVALVNSAMNLTRAIGPAEERSHE